MICRRSPCLFAVAALFAGLFAAPQMEFAEPGACVGSSEYGLV
jgi:hypothetical protein